MLVSFLVIAVTVAALAYKPTRQRVTELVAQRDLNKRVRQVRINAYNVLATNWCDGSLVREVDGEYRTVRNAKGEVVKNPYTGKPEQEWVTLDEPRYDVCLEGGILVGAGWPAAQLRDFTSEHGGSSINEVLSKVKRGRLDYVEGEDGNYVQTYVPYTDVPETFDAEAAEEAMRRMASEIEGEARFRALVEAGKVVQANGESFVVPQLLGINDDERFGKPVVLEIVRDALFDSPDDEIVEEAERRLRGEVVDA